MFARSRILDFADGLQRDQFYVGSREQLSSLEELEPIYRDLLDKPITAVVAVTAPDGRPNLTPMWFGYEGDRVFVNTATHRKKVGWVRQHPHFTILLMNPENPFHWVSIRATVDREILEDDPKEGHLATETIDRAWTKYTGKAPPYGLRDPERNERRVLFICNVDRVATFGRPS